MLIRTPYTPLVVALMLLCGLPAPTAAQAVTPPPNSPAPTSGMPASMRAGVPQPNAGTSSTPTTVGASDFVAARRTQPVNPFTGHAARRDELQQRAEILEAELKVETLTKAIKEARGGPVATTARAIPNELPRLSSRTASSSQRQSGVGTRAGARSAPLRNDQPPSPVVSTSTHSIPPQRPVANFPRLAAVSNQGSHLEALIELSPGRFEQFKENESKDGLKLDNLTATSAVLNGKRHRLRIENATVAEASGSLSPSMAMSAPIASSPFSRGGAQPVAATPSIAGGQRPFLPGAEFVGMPAPGQPIASPLPN